MSRRRLKRIMVLLTEAQAGWLRAAVRSFQEDQSIAGMLSAADERMANTILEQLIHNPLKHINHNEIMETALTKIASCEKHVDGDVVDIARKALLETKP